MNAAKLTNTAKHAMAQDYWLQVMNVGERFAVMQAVGGWKRPESERAYFHRCLEYVTQTKWVEVVAHQEKLLIEMGVGQ